MTIREATRDEAAHWDALIAAAPGGLDPFQLVPYAEIKSASWKTALLIHEHAGRPDVPTLYLQRSLPPFGELWFAPMGPRVTDPEHFQLICDDLRQVSGVFEVILEPSIPASSPQTLIDLVASTPGLADHTNLSQGQHTVLVDLSPDEDEIVASFRQRGRRSVRKAIKQGAVTEHRTDPAAIEAFWPLYAETIDRAGLPIRPKDYYVRTWQQYLELGEGHFVLARTAPEDETPVAGAFIWHQQHLGFYRDGGSVRSPAANGLQYLVQWEAMKWCKEHGATTYDLFGAPPSWQADDPDHQLHGLVQFKTAFAPIIDHVGTVRLAVKPAKVQWWDRIGFRVHQRLHRRVNPYFY